MRRARSIWRNRRHLRRDTHGAAALEFAFVAPALFLFLVGGIEFAIVLFINSSIESAVFEASRFGITGGSRQGVSRADRVLEIVTERTHGLLNMDDVSIETLIYARFADIGKPEPFLDTNGNGAHDPGESFTDVNGNGEWDPDMGRAGLGGPSDIVVYRLTYAWGIMTPLMRDLLGDEVRNVASVAVRNEPF